MYNSSPTFKALSPVIGMEVQGIDLARPTPTETIRSLTEAISHHCILLFREQDLTPEQHINFSRYFGELEPHATSATAD